jgi:hypothetical protein
MTDITEFHDANSIDTDRDRNVLSPGSEIYSHQYQEVDRRQLLEVDGITAYELTLECQSKDCSQEADLILTVGDFPESPEEVDDLMYELYRWFYDNSVELRPYREDESVYTATYALIAGTEKSRSLLQSRIALFLAADTGYQDGQHNRERKQKRELLRTAKEQTRSSLQHIEAEQHPILERFY